MQNKISIRNARYAKIGLIDMCDYIEDMSEFSMVEIGSYVGDSSNIFAERVKELNCIDPWENGYDENDGASSNVAMNIVEAQFDLLLNSFSNIRKLKMKSREALNMFRDNSLDLVYVDGLHTEQGVFSDITMWLPKIKKGGYIAGHDYGSKHFPGVRKAIDSFFEPDKTFRDSSWIKRL